MSVAYGASGGFAYSASAGATSITPAYPSGITAGQLLVLMLAMKPSTANSGSVTTPSGWTSVGSITGAGGYGATLGADTGNTNLFVYTKEATGSESGTLSVTVATNNVSAAFILRLTKTKSAWDTSAYATGSQTTTPTSPLSVASGSLAITAGDFVIAAFSTPTDVTTPSQYSAETFTQTGTTFGTVTEIGEWDSTIGNDLGGVAAHATVSSGSGSGAFTFGATITGTLTNVRGPLFVLRVRDKTSSFNQNVTASVTASAAAIRDAQVNVAASVAASGSLLASKVLLRALTATVNAASSLTKQSGKVLSDTVNVTGSLVRNISKTLADTVTVTPILSASKVLLQALTATVTTTGSMVRATAKMLTDTVTGAGALTRQTGKTVAGTASLTSSVTRLTSKTLTDTVTVTAIATRQAAKTLADSVSTTATVTRVAAKTLSDTVTTSSAMVKAVVKPLSDVVTQTATLARQARITKAATSTVTSSVQRAASKTLSAGVSIVASLLAVVAQQGGQLIGRLFSRDRAARVTSPRGSAARTYRAAQSSGHVDSPDATSTRQSTPDGTSTRPS